MNLPGATRPYEEARQVSEVTSLPNTYTLEFDRDAQLIPTARIFAGALARQFGCDEDSVLDVKIAVSEACTDAVTSDGGSNPVRIVVQDRGSELVYDVSDAEKDPEVQFESRPAPKEDIVMGVALIGALFPGAEISKGDKGTHVRFRLTAPAA
jgi:anti-sigma regulatory factor (Ser/Thr protein kinase)